MSTSKDTRVCVSFGGLRVCVCVCVCKEEVCVCVISGYDGPRRQQIEPKFKALKPRSKILKDPVCMCVCVKKCVCYSGHRRTPCVCVCVCKEEVCVCVITGFEGPRKARR